MPRNLINNYTFYKIVCLDNAVDLSYVGSTADFNKRKSTHKSDCYNQKRPAYNFKVYRTIRENGGWSNFKMVEIAKQEQLTLREAEQIEEKYRINLNAEMNDRSCFRTEEERIQIKKDYDKEWRENNKEYINEKSKNYRENNPEYTQTPEYKANKVLHNKKYRENNPDYHKKYAQTETAKAAKALHQKKYRDKIKLQKEQLKNNKE